MPTMDRKINNLLWTLALHEERGISFFAILLFKKKNEKACFKLADIFCPLLLPLPLKRAALRVGYSNAQGVKRRGG